jgi:hypothetical protein
MIFPVMEMNTIILGIGIVVLSSVLVIGCVNISDTLTPRAPCISGNLCNSGCLIQPDQICCNGQVINSTYDDCCNAKIIVKATTICCSGSPYPKEEYECVDGKAVKKQSAYPIGTMPTSWIPDTSSSDEYRGLDPEKYPGPNSKSSSSSSGFDSSSPVKPGILSSAKSSENPFSSK